MREAPTHIYHGNKIILLYNRTNYLTEFGILYPPPPKRRQGGPAETTLDTQWDKLTGVRLNPPCGSPASPSTPHYKYYK